MSPSTQAQSTLDHRYEMGDVLAETDSSMVLRGLDREAEREVCIKLLKTTAEVADPAAVLRFRREAMTLSEISCPSVVQVFDFGSLDGNPAIVMELVKGESLRALIDRGTVPLLTGLKLLLHLSEGLDRIHRLGVIHRDIKPANVLVTDAEAGELRIIDFGLAAVKARSSMAEACVAGTLHYMAPEQAGLICRPVGERADLYSVGCLAYALFAGRPPFIGDQVETLLRSIQVEEPPALRSFAPELPVTLVRIVDKLLKKNPDDRYHSAASLHYDLQRLIEPIEKNRAAPVFEPDQSQRQRFRQLGTVTVGREEELAEVQALGDKVIAGRPQMVLVAGVSGSGKSTFVYQVINHMMLRGARSVQGKCHEVSSRSPWSALGEILSDLYALYTRLPASERQDIAARLNADLQDSAGHLLRAAPEWRAVVRAAADSAYEGYEKDIERATAMLRKVLAPFATARTPLVVFLDDLQWGDSSSINLINSICEDLQDLRVLFLCAYRSNEIEGHDAVQELVARAGNPDTPVQKVDIGPLSSREIRRLIEEWLAVEVPAEIVDLVTERSAGNAFFVWEVLRALLEAGVFVEEGERLSTHLDALAKVELPSNLLEVLLTRLRLLPPATRKVLGVAATYGKDFSFDLLQVCVDTDEGDTFDAVALAEESGVIVSTQTEGGRQYSFAHDQLLAACAEFVEAGEKPSIHLGIARWSEERALREANGTVDDIPEDRLYSIGYHYVHSNDRAKSRTYASLGAERARKLMQNEVARLFYEDLLGYLEEDETTEAEEFIATRMAHAEILDRLGQFAETEQAYSLVLEYPTDAVGSARIKAKLASVQQKRGKYQESQQNLVSALEGLGIELAVNREDVDWSELLSDLRDELDTVLADGDKQKRKAKERETLIAELLTRLWYYHSFYDSGAANEKMYYLAYRLLAFTALYADSSELAVAHRCMSITLCQGLAPQYDEAVRHAFRSVDVARRIDAKMATGVGYCYIGIVMVWQSRYEEALGYLEQSRAMLEQIGNPWEVVNTHIFAMMAKRPLGQVEAALGHALEIVRIAERTKAPGSLASGYWKVADLLVLRGETARGKEYLDKALDISSENDLRFDHFNSLKIRAGHLIDEAEYDEAIACLDKAMELVESNPFMRAYIYDTHIALAEALIGRASTLEKGSRERIESLDRARGLVDLAIDMESRYLRHLPYARRVRVQLLAEEGRRGAALDAVREARSAISRLNNLLEQPRLMEVEATLRLPADPEAALDKLQQAKSLWKDFGAPAQAKRVEDRIEKLREIHGSADQTAERQSDALLQVSLASSHSLDVAEQAESVLDVLLEVTMAERAFLFLENEGQGKDEFELAASRKAGKEPLEDTKSYSRTVISRVRRSREPIVIAGTEEGRLIGSHSAVMYDLRSIMAAPLICRGRFLGVVYLDNRLGEKLRTDEDVQFLQAMANQIAIFIDGARSARLEVERAAMEKDLALSATVQKLFMPEDFPMRCGELELIGTCNPAEHAGGDWWWLDRSKKGQARIVLGDVAGHGVASAMVTVSMASLCRHILRDPTVAMTACLRSMHDDLYELSSGEYPMAVLAVDAPEQGSTFRWWGGGAPSPLLMRAGGVEVVLGSGNSIGGESFELEERELELEPGDRLLLYSDGLTEQITKKGRPLGLKRLVKIFAKTRGMTLPETRQHLLDEFRSQRGDEIQADDVSFVLVGRRPS